MFHCMLLAALCSTACCWQHCVPLLAICGTVFHCLLLAALCSTACYCSTVFHRLLLDQLLPISFLSIRLYLLYQYKLRHIPNDDNHQW